MKHLIVFANPKKESFTRAIVEAIVEKLQSKEEDPVVRDLYAIGFNPVLTEKDMEMLAKGETPADIAQEQRYITDAEVITFVFPLWWSTAPAILKGYIDRVFSYGFAYKYGPTGMEGLLKGKKAVMIVPMGNTKESLRKTGMKEALKTTLETNILAACGLEPVAYEYLTGIESVDRKTLGSYIEDMVHIYKRL